MKKLIKKYQEGDEMSYQNKSTDSEHYKKPLFVGQTITNFPKILAFGNTQLYPNIVNDPNGKIVSGQLPSKVLASTKINDVDENGNQIETFDELLDDVPIVAKWKNPYSKWNLFKYLKANNKHKRLQKEADARFDTHDFYDDVINAAKSTQNEEMHKVGGEDLTKYQNYNQIDPLLSIITGAGIAAKAPIGIGTLTKDALSGVAVDVGSNYFTGEDFATTLSNATGIPELLARFLNPGPWIRRFAGNTMKTGIQSTIDAAKSKLKELKAPKPSPETSIEDLRNTPEFKTMLQRYLNRNIDTSQLENLQKYVIRTSDGDYTITELAQRFKNLLKEYFDEHPDEWEEFETNGVSLDDLANWKMERFLSDGGEMLSPGQVYRKAILFDDHLLDKIYPEFKGLTFAHEVDHWMSYPSIKFPKILNGLSAKLSKYFTQNNNTEIAARISQILNWKGITNIDGFTGDTYKNLFKEYLSNIGNKIKPALDNNMNDLYEILEKNNAWDALAEWASDPKNVKIMTGAAATGVGVKSATDNTRKFGGKLYFK